MKKNRFFIVGMLAAALTFGLVLAGCGNSSTNGSSFVPVTDITDIPVIALVNAELSLSGTVKPANATNKTITWSGDNVTGDVFKATASGYSQVTATIANGESESSPYTKTFTITAFSNGTTGTDPGTVANAITDAQGTWKRNVPEEGYTLKMVITGTDWTISVILPEDSEIPVCKGILITAEEGTYKVQQNEKYNESWYSHYHYETGTYSFFDNKNTLTLTPVPPDPDSSATGTWTKQP